MPEDRLEFRLVNNHPSASRREVAHFKNVRRSKVFTCLAAAQIALLGETSMWRYELRVDNKWKPFGRKSTEKVRAEVRFLAEQWNELDELNLETRKR